jgi:hypothetical protein
VFGLAREGIFGCRGSVVVVCVKVPVDFELDLVCLPLSIWT